MRYLRPAERDGLLFRQILYFCVCQSLWGKTIWLWHRAFCKSSPWYPFESVLKQGVWVSKGKEDEWVAEDADILIWSYRNSLIKWQPCQHDKEEYIDHLICFFPLLTFSLSSLSVFLKPWHFHLPGDAVCQAVAMVTTAHFAALAVPELFCRDGVNEGGSTREKKPTCWLPANWLFLFLLTLYYVQLFFSSLTCYIYFFGHGDTCTQTLQCSNSYYIYCYSLHWAVKSNRHLGSMKSY